MMLITDVNIVDTDVIVIHDYLISNHHHKVIDI